MSPMSATLSARDEILARIRTSLADRPDRGRAKLDWRYGRATELPNVLERFVERVEDYKARVVRTTGAALPQAIARALVESDADSVVVPPGLPAEWCSAIAAVGVKVVPDTAGAPLSHAQLDAVSAVVTGSRVSIAETGTIVLDHAADQGRRALTLLPDRHICVVRADSVVSDVPEAVAILARSIREGLPATWISGGSATSDIELERVEGVHGPRRLVVVLVD